MHPTVNKLVAPGQKRPGIWLGGIIQIMVTRACDLHCIHCTQGSNLAGRPVVMSPLEFEQAVDSLDQFTGIYGCFGGNPCLSPHFETYCEILRAKVAFPQRGLWSNHPRGQGKICRITFDPSHSNLNMHLNKEAYEEIKRDWPEAVPFVKGVDRDSVHGAPFVAMKDVEPDEEKRWAMIADCDVSRWWSAALGIVPGRGLRAYFCELAYAQAALHAGADDADDWPDTGMIPYPGWWKEPMAAFESQVNLHCHACGIPMRRPGQLAIGGEREEFSATHRSIARPKVRERPVEFVGVETLTRTARPATQYLPGVTPGYDAS